MDRRRQTDRHTYRQRDTQTDKEIHRGAPLLKSMWTNFWSTDSFVKWWPPVYTNHVNMTQEFIKNMTGAGSWIHIIIKNKIGMRIYKERFPEKKLHLRITPCITMLQWHTFLPKPRSEIRINNFSRYSVCTWRPDRVCVVEYMGEVGQRHSLLLLVGSSRQLHDHHSLRHLLHPTKWFLLDIQ